MKKIIELLMISPKDGKFNLSHFGTAGIKKRILYYPSFLMIPEKEFLYDFTFNFPFKYQKFISGAKMGRVNVRFTIDEGDYKRTFYCWLTYFQRLEISYYSKKLWFQNPTNIMWIINLLVALIASLAALHKCIR